jgi:hypothetical protein
MLYCILLQRGKFHPEGQIRHEADRRHRPPRRAGNARRGKGNQSGNAAFTTARHGAPVTQGGREPTTCSARLAPAIPVRDHETQLCA